MATKEAVFSLKVDTGSSVNDIKSFDQAVNSLNKDVNTLQSTVAEPYIRTRANMKVGFTHVNGAQIVLYS